LINALADDIGTDKGFLSEDGTSPVEFSHGLTYFLNQTSYSQYDAMFSVINDYDTHMNPIPETVNEYSDFQQLISKGNPAVLFVTHNINDPLTPFGGPHTFVAIGYFSNYYMGSGFIVYDNAEFGEVFIRDNYVEYFGFIYDR
jgi:hypothetical protein